MQGEKEMARYTCELLRSQLVEKIQAVGDLEDQAQRLDVQLTDTKSALAGVEVKVQVGRCSLVAARYHMTPRLTRLHSLR